MRAQDIDCLYMALSNIEKKTLLLMANHGPLAGYDLHSKKKDDGSGKYAETVIMSDVYWLNLRKKLLKLKLIKELPKKGRKKPYKLSEDGFDLILRSQHDKIKDDDRFVKNYKEYFPLVLGYWSELKKYNLDEYIKDSLRKIINRIYLDVVRDLILEKRARYSHEDFVKDLSTNIYIPDLFADDYDNDIINKINALSEEVSDINNFIKIRIKEEEIITQQNFNKINQVKKNHKCEHKK